MKKIKHKWTIAGLCIGMIGLLYYLQEERAIEVVTIYPSQKPTKIRPAEAGGIVIANTDSSIYDNLKPNNRHSLKAVNIPDDPERPLKIDFDDDPLPSIIAEFEVPNNYEPETTTAPDLNIITVPAEKSNLSKVIARKNKGSYALQLAVVKSESDGIKEWQKISKTCSKVVNGLEMHLEKIRSKDDRIFYLLLAGNYPNLGKAKADCRKLAKYQQSCTIYEFKNR